MLGLFATALFSARMHLPRATFVLPYALVAGLFLSAFVRWTNRDVFAMFQQNLGWSLFTALFASGLLVKSVLSQPAAPRTTGWQFLWDAGWLGVVYGLIDALLLNVMPVLAAWQAFARLGWMSAQSGRIADQTGSYRVKVIG